MMNYTAKLSAMQVREFSAEENARQAELAKSYKDASIANLQFKIDQCTNRLAMSNVDLAQDNDYLLFRDKCLDLKDRRYYDNEDGSSDEETISSDEETGSSDEETGSIDDEAKYSDDETGSSHTRIPLYMDDYRNNLQDKLDQANKSLITFVQNYDHLSNESLITFDQYYDFIKLAKDAVMNERLHRLKHVFSIEHTINGNLIMTYNHDIQHFQYYSDQSISGALLEPLIHKFMVIYDCKEIGTTACRHMGKMSGFAFLQSKTYNNNPTKPISYSDFLRSKSL